jgi:hypothetical protein
MALVRVTSQKIEGYLGGKDIPLTGELCRRGWNWTRGGGKQPLLPIQRSHDLDLSMSFAGAILPESRRTLKNPCAV